MIIKFGRVAYQKIIQGRVMEGVLQMAVEGKLNLEVRMQQHGDILPSMKAFPISTSGEYHILERRASM